jgi:hypothetical protein
MRVVAWEAVGAVPPKGLVEARLRLHHAAQLVAAVGRSLAPAQADDGHTSLEWRRSPRGLVGQDVPGPVAWRASLWLEELAVVLRVGDTEVGTLGLLGQTRDEAFAWLVTKAKDLGAPAGKLTLAAPYSLPDHALARGGAFEALADGSFAELGHWFANGDAVLRGAAEGWARAAAVRVWPHHFDVGSVLPLGTGGGDDAPSLGIGLSPGDESIAEPYFYVTAWPARASLPELPAGGHWHREGWTGAVLTGSEIVAAGDGAAQAATAYAFLSGTIAALGSAPP